jgi:hypothetical protein
MFRDCANADNMFADGIPWPIPNRMPESGGRVASANFPAARHVQPITIAAFGRAFRDL